jgi:transcriptional regulator with XRE-family HTH domain
MSVTCIPHREALRQLLCDRGMSVNELARRGGINPQHLSRVLNPKHRAQLTWDMAVRISIVLSSAPLAGTHSVTVEPTAFATVPEPAAAE